MTGDLRHRLRPPGSSNSSSSSSSSSSSKDSNSIGSPRPPQHLSRQPPSPSPSGSPGAALAPHPSTPPGRPRTSVPSRGSPPHGSASAPTGRPPRPPPTPPQLQPGRGPFPVQRRRPRPPPRQRRRPPPSPGGAPLRAVLEEGTSKILWAVAVLLLRAGTGAAAALLRRSSLLRGLLPASLLDAARHPGLSAALPPLLLRAAGAAAFSSSPSVPFPSPLLPCRTARAAEGGKGTAARDLAVLLPLHFAATLAAALAVRAAADLLLQGWGGGGWAAEAAQGAGGGLGPLPYGGNGDGAAGQARWLASLATEAALSALLVVGLRVVPELLRLNRVRGPVPLWTFALVVWPLGLVSVDGRGGGGSCFAPDLAYALHLAGRGGGVAPQGGWGGVPSSHLLGPVVGGWVGGKILAEYFPEE